MTTRNEPRGESEWSRRAIFNVLDVLAEHIESLTLVGSFEGIVDPRRIDQVFDDWMARLRAG